MQMAIHRFSPPLLTDRSILFTPPYSSSVWFSVDYYHWRRQLSLGRWWVRNSRPMLLVFMLSNAGAEIARYLHWLVTYFNLATFPTPMLKHLLELISQARRRSDALWREPFSWPHLIPSPPNVGASVVGTEVLEDLRDPHRPKYYRAPSRSCSWDRSAGQRHTIPLW